MASAFRKFHVLEEEKCFGSSRAERDFWRILGGGEQKAREPGEPEEDEEFESTANGLNLVWEVSASKEDGREELRPIEVGQDGECGGST